MNLETPSSSPSPRAEPGGRLKRDVLASLVVFLVALPLCMGIARACGLPVIHGIITGVIGGLVVGLLAGCPLQVSGPAAGLLRLGQWFRAVSPAVIEGMLAGIGVLIILSQFPAMVDGRPPAIAPPPYEAGIHPGPQPAPGEPAVKEEGLFAEFRETATEVWAVPVSLHEALFPAEGSANTPWALMIGVLTITVLVAWQPLVPRRLKVIPAAFVAVLVAIPAAFFLPAPIKTLEPVGDIPQALWGMMAWPGPWELWTYLSAPGVAWKVVEYTVMMAFIASAETMLCASAVDKMVPDAPRTKYDRELWAQGVGNLLCGLLHALPMTGVVVRSKANIEAGGQTRLAAILHGLWLLVFITAFPFLLPYIPTAALAAVLVYTGFRLIDVQAIREMAKRDRFEVVIYFVTLSSVVVFNLLHGVIIGSVLALAKLLYNFSHLAVRVEKDPTGRRTVMYLEGAATFIRLPQLAAALEAVPDNTELHVHMEQLSYIDHACLELFIGWEKRHEATGGSLVMDWESLHAKFRGPGQNGAATAAAAQDGESGSGKETPSIAR
jgi:MFS superfamily sulfate permease-like transporter